MTSFAMPTMSKEILRQLEALLVSSRPAELAAFLDRLTPADTARAVARLNEAQRERLFDLVSPPEAAAVLQDLPDAQAAGVIAGLDPEQAAPIVEQLPADERADVLGGISRPDAAAILDAMTPQAARQARNLMTYPPNTAGGLMSPDFLAYPEEWTVHDLIVDVRLRREQYARYDIQYIYVLGRGGELAGVLRMRDLLLAAPAARLRELEIRGVVTVAAAEPLEHLAALFQARGYLGLPVLDAAGRLLGVVSRQRVMEAMGERDQQTFLKVSGILGGEELRSMPLRRRITGRLSWLSLNVLLNLCAASVIAFYQDTLAAAVVLAVFLPIISDMSGCSGNQAVAVSIRELSLGLIRPKELGRVFFKEVGLGLINGLVLGLLLSLVALLWQGNPYLGLVVGVALAANTVLSACLGGLLPLMIRRLNLDPALASGPILTTITDMCGFFLVLSLASLMLPHLAHN